MNTETTHKGYDSLTGEQLVYLQMMVNDWVDTPKETTFVRTNPNRIVAKSGLTETTFDLNDGDVANHLLGHREPFFNQFLFVETCHKFGLTY